jgi:hypothetical protein
MGGMNAGGGAAGPANPCRQLTITAQTVLPSITLVVASQSNQSRCGLHPMSTYGILSLATHEHRKLFLTSTRRYNSDLVVISIKAKTGNSRAGTDCG